MYHINNNSMFNDSAGVAVRLMLLAKKHLNVLATYLCHTQLIYVPLLQMTSLPLQLPSL